MCIQPLNNVKCLQFCWQWVLPVSTTLPQAGHTLLLYMLPSRLNYLGTQLTVFDIRGPPKDMNDIPCAKTRIGKFNRKNDTPLDIIHTIHSKPTAAIN